MDWGLTYDDGPSFYTSNLLNYLDQVNLKSTFFVVGSRVISFPATLQTQYMAGHHIAVHTWSHPSLTTLTNEEIIAELGWSKKVIKDVLGVTPNMMRPPFGDIEYVFTSCRLRFYYIIAHASKQCSCSCYLPGYGSHTRHLDPYQPSSYF